jgi:hypothetical protein
MALSFVNEFKLARPKGDGFHPYLNVSGAFLGTGTPLLERDSHGRWRPRRRATLEHVLAKGYGVPVDLEWRMDSLATVARALNRGDRCLAAIALVHAELPALPDAGAAKRMAKADRVWTKFNPDVEAEPRNPQGSGDISGRWTVAGGGSAAARSLLARLTPATLSMLARLASGLAGPVALLGGLLIPTNNTPRTIQGVVRGDPNASYELTEGILSLWWTDASNENHLVPLASNLPDADGYYRLKDGTIVARKVGSAILLDTQAISEAAALQRLMGDEADSSGAIPPSQPGEDRSPERCEKPQPDRGGRKGPQAVAYENFIHNFINPIEPLQPNEAIRVFNEFKAKPTQRDWVYFDDCHNEDQEIGKLVEAKGPGYEAAFNSSSQKFRDKLDAKLLDQAGRQTQAAGSRGVEWYFAEQGAADHVRKLFSDHGIRIKVIYLPMSQ